MKKSHFISALSAVVFACISMSSHANLIGVLPATPGGTDYQAYYDDVADLTWLADANAAVGSAYDTAIPGSGRMNWSDANAWAASLNINGVTGWRLPTTDTASDGFNQTGSEMGNLYYNVLGGPDYPYSLLSVHNSNFDLFSNIMGYEYWTSTADTDVNYAWYFDVSTGYQSYYSRTINDYAWAVHSGNVGSASVVPVPAAVWLFGSGLLGLVGMARRKKAA